MRTSSLHYNTLPPRQGIQQPLVWAGVLAATLLFVALFDRILWISLPAILAVIVYYVCAPAVGWLKRGGLSHGQAVLGLVVAIVVAVAVAASLMLPSLGAQLYVLQQHGGNYVDRGKEMIVDTLAALEAHFPGLARAHLAEQARSRLDLWTDGMLERNMQAFFSFLATWLPAFLLVPYLTFFFLQDGPRFKKLLMRGVPNAFFEKVMLLFHRMDHQIHQYFRGMVALTILDTLTLGLGLWIIGWEYGGHLFRPGQALFLGLACAVLAWLPYVGSLAGCVLVMLVCATEAPHQPVLTAGAVVLFALARLIDDFFYSPLTVGKSLNIHPLMTVVMIFIAGSIAGIPGLFLVLPVLGICSVAGEVFEQVWFDEHLRARHAHAISLRKRAAAESVQI